MNIPGRSKQQRKMQTTAGMMTRPMHIDTPVDYAERSGAAFLPTFEAMVLVPFSESLVTGLYAGLGAVGVLSALAIIGSGWVETFTWWFIVKSVFCGGLIVGFIAACYSWWTRDYKALLWYTEFAEGPEQQTETKQVHEGRVRVNNNWVHADLPFDRDNPGALVEFAKGVVSNIAPFSERGAGRYGYSVTRFNELRDGFIRGRLATWKDPKNKRLGVALTAGGRSLLQSVAENPPPADYEPPADDWGMSNQSVQK